ncbi:hypothetical protein [Psychromonas antarctica]|uniref:hypothetical protein n=1 Tax=Psychromonas antarctica TaxID=67573 RepID=UPI001EE7B0FE|nr:hypothetical protein [Psychromonas antarctica]MCG6202708.1 hypothetical protein [Psychromonas antarctica]
MITEDQLGKFKLCFPHGTIKALKNKRIEILRHPKTENFEVFSYWKNVASLIARITNSWEKHKHNIFIHGSEIITDREHYYGRDTKLEFHCLKLSRGHSWEDTYANVDAQISKWDRKDYPTDEQKVLTACPNCRKSISKTNTQKYHFEKMSNENLLIAARNVPSENLESNGTFRGKYPVLSNEMNTREVHGKSLLKLFSEEQAWRGIRPELMNYSFNDWWDYLELSEYKTIGEWKKGDPRAQCVCSTLHKDTHYKNLRKEFFNKGRLTLDGIQYDSTSELLVAKVLSHLNISFKPHGKWGFYYKISKGAAKQRKQRHPEYDFKFSVNGKKFIVEVWLCSKDNLTENEMKDNLLLEYIDKRDIKIKKALIYQSDVTLVSIEARINRKSGQKAFLEHVQEVMLNKIGLSEVSDIDFESLYEGDPRPLSQWNVCDFFRECSETNAKQISDLSISLQNRLRKNKNIQVSLAQLLARKHGYPLNTLYYLAPLPHVIEYCSKRLELSVRTVYKKLHTRGKLPHGFPQRVTNAYKSIATHREICGLEAREFIDYFAAKKVVQKYQFKHSGEFEAARDSNDVKFSPLKQIYKLPDHPITGYPEWENWATFLGNKKSWESTPEGRKALDVLKEGSVKAVASYIRRTLRCHRKSELRKISVNAVKALDLNPKAQDIEIVVFGCAMNLCSDLEIVAKTVKLEHLLTENIWRKERSKHKTYQRILAKFHLKHPSYKGDWNNILKLINCLNNK